MLRFFVVWRRSDGPLAAQWSEESLRRRSQQQCSLWVGAEGGDASRFRFATPAAMVEALFRSVWMSTGLGGELDTQSMPRPRLPQIAKTCFDGELFLSGRAQMSVPAGPERSSCVPVHTIRPTERPETADATARARRDTSCLTCLERPFLGGERALAVERTNAGAYGDSQKGLA